MTSHAARSRVAPPAKANRLARSMNNLEIVPSFARSWVRSRILGRAVPFTGTAGLEFAVMTHERVEVIIANHRRV